MLSLERIVKGAAAAVDPDRGLEVAMSSLIRLSRAGASLGASAEVWSPEKPLSIVLAGYNGTRNTGSDVRVSEIVRQLQTILPKDRLALSAMSFDLRLSEGYFEGVRQIATPFVFPKFFFDQCRRHHAVIVSEGTMFQSRFSHAFSVGMAGALGLAAAEGKPSVGYGADALPMEPALEAFVKRHCAGSLILCRNDVSRSNLERLGVRTRRGTDTAWTFEPPHPELGREALLAAGWDGKAKVLAVCPVNPFWWPTRSDLYKYAVSLFSDRYAYEHYRSIYFHDYPEEAKRRYDRYLDAIASAVRALARDTGVFTVLVGMEMIDCRACEELAARIDPKPPIFASDRCDMYELVRVLRSCSLILSSRYHAVVTSMTALVPSAGLSGDQRLTELMSERGHADLCVGVQEDDLADKTLDLLRRLDAGRERIASEIGACLPRQFELMGQMGIDFVDEIGRVYPDYPRRDVPRSWDRFLPPLAPRLADLIARHA